MAKFERLGVRLAMRHEGKWWNAYLAEEKTMEGATLMGSIHMTLVENKERRDAFLNLMRDCLSDTIKETTGITPEYPEGTQPAPEHERSGHS